MPPKYEIKQLPNFSNYYRKMQEQRERQILKKQQLADRELARRLQAQQNDQHRRAASGQATQRVEPLLRNMTTSQKFKDINPQNVSSGKQFNQYLKSTPNVFYEDRQEVYFLKKFQIIKPLVVKLFVFLFVFWLLLTFVQPYHGICPSNADCGVYVHCHAGYKLINGRCVVSEETRELANLVCEAVVENLQYDYGSQDCQSEGGKPIPYKQLSQVFQQYGVGTRAAEEEIENWFRQRKNQDKYQFSFSNEQIRPRQKKYTIFCRFQKIVNTPGFYIFFSLAVLLFLIILIWLRVLGERSRAWRIYDSLKKKLRGKYQIVINIEQLEAQHGKIYEQLWFMVNQHRVREAIIGYYQDQHLHWKLLQ